MHDAKELLKSELIGKNAAVTDAKNRANIGIKGKIVDETKNTLTIATEKGKKRLIKKNIIIEIAYNNKRVRIRGDILAVAPEERIKTKVK